MDKDLIEKTTHRIRTICKNWGIPRNDQEDCIQHIFLKRVEGKAKHQLVAHSVIDWMRHQYGSDKRKDEEGYRKFRNAREYDPKTDGFEYKEHMSEEFLRIIKRIDCPRAREIVVRRDFYGETNNEIALSYGVNESRISQIYWKTVRILQSEIDISEL